MLFCGCADVRDAAFVGSLVMAGITVLGQLYRVAVFPPSSLPEKVRSSWLQAKDLGGHGWLLDDCVTLL